MYADLIRLWIYFVVSCVSYGEVSPYRQSPKIDGAEPEEAANTSILLEGSKDGSHSSPAHELILMGAEPGSDRMTYTSQVPEAFAVVEPTGTP